MKTFGLAARAVALLLGCNLATPADAQITYLQLQPDGSQILRQMNADGSGDTVVPVPLIRLENPTWSRDGAELAITASDKPGEHTQNVFSISAATGAVAKLTRYSDIFDEVNQSLSYTFPHYKVFSPDRAALATSIQAQAAGGGGNAIADFPVLEIHSLTSITNALLVGIDAGFNAKHHGGEGVDWSPNQNVLAVPRTSTAPFLSGGGPGNTTAIFLVEPSTGAVQLNHLQQITFPRSDAHIGTSDADTYFWDEHDYQPRFSPNGTGLAYVRSFQLQSLLNPTSPQPDVQSLHILNLGTGQDTEVVVFPEGRYVSTLNWSPDGNQLVFDLGLQSTSLVGMVEQKARPETNQIYVVNVNDGSLQQLRGNGNSGPAFGPRINMSAPTPTPTPNPQQPVSLGNISTRIRVGAGDDALIGGFIITGSQPKQVLIRAIGPSLGSAGVQGALSNPSLKLHQGSATVASNDNWQEATNTNEIPNGFAPADARESVIVATLAPGSYTAVVRGVGGETGVGLFEAYDLSGSGSARVANVSTRGLVDLGDNLLIGGFIAVGDGGSAKVVVRAIGPTLQNAGVADALQDPLLELHDGNGAVVQSNNNWKDSQQAEVTASQVAPTDDRESALVATLAPGNYTAVVRSATGTGGIGLVEVYNIN